VRDLGYHLLGRRLYEAMLYWETEPPDQPFDAAEREFAERWKAVPTTDGGGLRNRGNRPSRP
jgi:hypothetical protein